LESLIGDIDQGFIYIGKALERRHQLMRFIKVDPAFDNVLSDPRYKEILKKMNLE